MESKNELSVNGEKSVNERLDYNRANHWPDVKPAEKILVHEYSIAGNLRAAAKSAGIGPDRASRVLRDPVVAGYLDYMMEGLRDESIIKRQFVELQYLETLEQVNGDVDVPIVDRDGITRYAKKFDAPSKVSLLKDLARFSGVDKGINGTGSTPVTVNFDFSKFGVGEAPEISINGGDNSSE